MCIYIYVSIYKQNIFINISMFIKYTCINIFINTYLFYVYVICTSFCSLDYNFTEDFMLTIELGIGQQLDLIWQKLISNRSPFFILSPKRNTMQCFFCISAFCIPRTIGSLVAFIHFSRWRH